MTDEPQVEIFYSDPVNEDGNPIADATMRITHSTIPVALAKIPHSEMVLDDAKRITLPDPE